MGAIRSMPCEYCPYRRDVPSGVWSHDDYDKLRGYDQPTGAQPFAVFACHATPDHLCHGWAVVHSTRGHDHELLALRLHGVNAVDVEAGVPLWPSGNAAADHGQADIEDPSDEAIEAVARLTRKYDRLDEAAST